LAAGCSGSSGRSPNAADEETVRETFTAFQKALKDCDADRLWGLLDADSRADAERAAKAVQAAYAKAGAAEKAELEKGLGLSGAELARLTGTTFLKTNRFQGKYFEVPDSKIDKVSVKGDKATLTYVENDGDKEKFTLIRTDGTWKLSVPMPKAAP
jgi:hypothetical protein